jgi:thiamine pyrophosphokinase
MKHFKRQMATTAGAILIALGLIGINADQAIAQAKARKGAKIRSGSAPSIISPRDAASGLPTGIRVDQTRRPSFFYSAFNNFHATKIPRHVFSPGASSK